LTENRKLFNQMAFDVASRQRLPVVIRSPYDAMHRLSTHTRLAVCPSR